LPAFCPQIPPIVPFLPTVPTRKCRAVYNLRFERFHGMEEVTGSIPVRSTNHFNNFPRPSVNGLEEHSPHGFAPSTWLAATP